jgi:hypothetical protein
MTVHVRPFLVWCRDYCQIDSLTDDVARELGLYDPVDSTIPDLTHLLTPQSDRERILVAAIAVIKQHPEVCGVGSVEEGRKRTINLGAVAQAIVDNWNTLFPHHVMPYKNKAVLQRTLSKWLSSLRGLS